MMPLRKASVLIGSAALILTASTAGAGASAASRVTLTMWAVNATNFSYPHEVLIKQFEKKYPNITVKLDTFPDATFPTKLEAASLSGTFPDIMEGKTVWAVPYMASGALAQIPASVATASQLRQGYFPGPLAAQSFRGHDYGIPANFSTEAAPVVPYNKVIFARHHVSPPWKTWSDFVHALEAVTKRNARGQITRAGLEISPGPFNYEVFAMFLMDYGGTFLNKAGTKFGFDSPAGVKALQLLNTLENVDHIDAPTVGHGLASDIGRGYEAVSMGGPWLMHLVKQSHPSVYPDLAYATMPLPPGSTVKKSPFLTFDGWGWYVFRSSKHITAAEDLLRFLSQPSNEALWAQNAGEIPARVTVAHSAAYLKADPFAKSWLAVLKQGVALRYVGTETKFQDILSNMITSVILHKASVKQALSTAQSQEDQMLSADLKLLKQGQ